MAQELNGRDLDAAVAERVFGYEVAEHEGVKCRVIRDERGERIGIARLPGFSTEIEWGWRVFVWLVERTESASIGADLIDMEDDEFVTTRCLSPDTKYYMEMPNHTMPEGACRLALMWLDAKAFDEADARGEVARLP